MVARASGETPQAVAHVLDGLGCVGGLRLAPAAPGRVRAFLRVQDGCSFSCAFCVIPQVRGGTRSRPLEAILAEAGRRVRQGFGELVLAGVNVGLYRARDEGEAGSGSPR